MTETYTWTPDEDYRSRSNAARLMRTLGVRSTDELRAASVADIGAFWDTVVRDLGIPFRTPYRTVVDLGNGIEHPEWFVGGGLNVVDACVGRWADRHQAWQQLLERGVLVRETGPAGYLRVSAGTPQEMEAFYAALEQVDAARTGE